MASWLVLRNTNQCFRKHPSQLTEGVLQLRLEPRSAGHRAGAPVEQNDTPLVPLRPPCPRLSSGTSRRLPNSVSWRLSIPGAAFPSAGSVQSCINSAPWPQHWPQMESLLHMSLVLGWIRIRPRPPQLAGHSTRRSAADLSGTPASSSWHRGRGQGRGRSMGGVNGAHHD